MLWMISRQKERRLCKAIMMQLKNFLPPAKISRRPESQPLMVPRNHKKKQLSGVKKSTVVPLTPTNSESHSQRVPNSPPKLIASTQKDTRPSPTLEPNWRSTTSTCPKTS
jgi:hypothetical protein